jgi:hypothetical protein
MGKAPGTIAKKEAAINGCGSEVILGAVLVVFDQGAASRQARAAQGVRAEGAGLPVSAESYIR